MLAADLDVGDRAARVVREWGEVVLAVTSSFAQLRELAAQRAPRLGNGSAIDQGLLSFDDRDWARNDEGK
jgi:hypothetical protein